MKDHHPRDEKPPRPDSGENKKILVLSSDEAMFDKVRTLLSKKTYYEVIHKTSFDEAYPDIRDGKVDFVLYDVNLALEEGMKKLDMLKAANDKVPVVVSAVLEKP
jgi:DNA-binding NtrC family response regulator